MAKKSIKKKKTRAKKSEKPKSVVPRGEVLMILVLFMSFVLIAVSKCNIKKKEMNNVEKSIPKIALKDTVTLIEADHIKNIDTSKVIISSPSISSQPIGYSKLFVTIDSLKLRKAPNLDSIVLQRLVLYDEVLFLDETTDFTQEITLNGILHNEPWIKIRTKKGTVGWSYGAGLSYYRIKNKK